MVIPTLIAVQAAMRHTLFQEFEQVLQNDLDEIGLAMDQFYPEDRRAERFLERKREAHKKSGWFVRVIDENGEILFSSPVTPPFDFVPPVSPATFQVDKVWYSQLERTVRLSGDILLRIQVGASLESVHEDISLLTRMMILAGGLLLIVTPLGCYWLAGRATAPIAQIIEATSQLRPSQLNERLPLRNTGDELDRLSQTINGLLDRLATFVNEKRDFLANAAHELRSPLAAIRTSVEVALNNERSSEEYVALLEEIMEECSDLGILVNQLLLLTESDKGDLGVSTRVISLDRVVQRSLNMFHGVAEAQGVELVCSRLDRAMVRGDDHHLQQVINNLVDNAIKFTSSPGQVRVEVQANPEEHFALLQVSDTGLGICPEDQARIFERFYRADLARKRVGQQRGNGLGLAICQSIVTLLGGSIWVKSQPGVGSTFSVRLPMAKECAAVGSGK